MSTSVCLLTIIFLSALTCAGQGKLYNNLSTKSKKASELYEKADYFYVRKDYRSVVDYLQKAIKKDNEFIEAYFRLGNSQYKLGDTLLALSNWEKAISIAGETPGHSYLYYYIGELYFETGAYQKSKAAFATYLTLNKADSRRKRNVEIRYKSAAFAVSAMEAPLEFNPQPVGGALNRFALQYFPVMPVDQQSMIFTRRLGIDPSQDEDLYISYKNADGDWQAPVSLSDHINTVFKEGTCSISADGRMLIFTSCYGRQGYGGCDLFVSFKSGSEWSPPENLGPGINTGAWDSQASLSADGRTLYFVSDREGGFGKRDIWVSRKGANGNWTKAENAGNAVNTPEDEVSPFIHPNGQRLYFASKGHIGMGGFDIYFSDRISQWSTPVNMGYPLNTGKDEVSLFITADGSKGYYSKELVDNNNQKRSLIYEIDIPETLRIINKSTFVEGSVYDAATKSPLEATVELINLLNDEKLLVVSSDSLTGNYLMVLTEGVEYGLYVTRQGYLYKSLRFNYDKKETGEPIIIDIYLEPVSTGAKTILNNIFFAVDAYELDPRSRTELREIIQFLEDNPEISIRIEGHTDNTGSESYNMELSGKRAKAVYDYLLAKGIDKERLSYKGFGMLKPLAENTTEENRALNRRIEFRIVE